MDVARGDRDETASPGMRGTAFEAEFLEEGDEPVDDRVRVQVPATIGTDHRPDGLDGFGQLLERYSIQVTQQQQQAKVTAVVPQELADRFLDLWLKK